MTYKYIHPIVFVSWQDIPWFQFYNDYMYSGVEFEVRTLRICLFAFYQGAGILSSEDDPWEVLSSIYLLVVFKVTNHYMAHRVFLSFITMSADTVRQVLLYFPYLMSNSSLHKCKPIKLYIFDSCKDEYQTTNQSLLSYQSFDLAHFTTFSM